MTVALEGGEWSAARLGHSLQPGKTRYPLYRRLGGPQGRSGRAKNLFPTGSRSQTVQPVVSRYTDRATRPTGLCRISAYERDLCLIDWLIDWCGPKLAPKCYHLWNLRVVTRVCNRIAYLKETSQLIGADRCHNLVLRIVCDHCSPY